MSLTQSNISALNSIFSEAQENVSVDSLTSTVTSAINDPISAGLNRVLFKISNVSSNIESKIDGLQQDVLKAADKGGNVELINNTIVITVKEQDVQKLSSQNLKIQNDVKSINSTLNVYKASLDSLKVISKTAQALKVAMEIQEALLNINPVSKATFTLFKKAIKIVFLKDMLSQYTTLINNQLSSNIQKFEDILNRFQNLKVEIKIADEKNSGNIVDSDQAQGMVISDLLDNNKTSDTNNTSSEYISMNGKTYILKVEKYGDKKLIGRAYEKISGLVAAETAPSYFSSPDDLEKELKDIINIF